MDDLPELHPIGHVESSLVARKDAPRQGHAAGAPEAWLVIRDRYAPALADVDQGDWLVVVTWLHEAHRDVLAVHPRKDPTTPVTGVFSTRSPDRPNPIGIHPVEVLEVVGLRVHVRAIEAIDGTPIVDLKPRIRHCHED